MKCIELLICTFLRIPSTQNSQKQRRHFYAWIIGNEIPLKHLCFKIAAHLHHHYELVSIILLSLFLVAPHYLANISEFRFLCVCSKLCVFEVCLYVSLLRSVFFLSLPNWRFLPLKMLISLPNWNSINFLYFCLITIIPEMIVLRTKSNEFYQFMRENFVITIEKYLIEDFQQFLSIFTYIYAM